MCFCMTGSHLEAARRALELIDAEIVLFQILRNVLVFDAPSYDIIRGIATAGCKIPPSPQVPAQKLLAKRICYICSFRERLLF